MLIHLQRGSLRLQPIVMLLRLVTQPQTLHRFSGRLRMLLQALKLTLHEQVLVDLRRRCRAEALALACNVPPRKRRLAEYFQSLLFDERLYQMNCQLRLRIVKDKTLT